MTEREVLKLALEALEQLQGGCTDSDDGTVEAITVWCPEVIDAIKEALAQPEQEVDWEKLYRLEVKKKEALAAKYERDIKPLTKIVPMAQPEQEPDGYVQKVIDALYENSDPVSVEAAELLEHMAQPEQEPVGEVLNEKGEVDWISFVPPIGASLYTTPQPAVPERKPLTDEEIEDLYFDKFSMGELKAFARAIEAKLKEKNT